MTLLSANDLSKFFGAEEIFGDIGLEIAATARIGLVGSNGAGKTTLIDILAGRDLPTSGNVSLARNLRLAFLPQRPELAGNHSLWDEQLNAFADLRAMERQLVALERAMTDADRFETALKRYGPLQAEFERLGGYTYDTRIKIVLSGLGFTAEEYDMPLPTLSGGQKTRALLARLLLEAPDLLILDEPTNHLDIEAVEWLEKFLQSYPGAVLAVSHDRYFLDNFAEQIWELEFKQLQVYRGNYSAYLRQRELRRDHLQKQFDAQQEFIAKERDYIRKHMGSRWTAQAKGRLKKLETMNKRGKIIASAPRQRGTMKLDISTNLRSGDQVFLTEDLQIGYRASTPLVSVPDLLVIRGETIAIIGPNGVGKSTLLKTLTGILPALRGTLRLGAKVKVGYFAQAHESLNSEKSILDEIISTKAMAISEARNFLGRFMFSNEDVFRAISTLSGGERGRVALAKLALQGANLLLLDEPTNHLDIDSQEILQAVLEGFAGTILLVSHDRYLINALASQIWAMTPGALNIYPGNYREYIRIRNRRLEGQTGADHNKTSKTNGKGIRRGSYAEKREGLNPFEAARRSAELEAKVSQLESRLFTIGEQLDAASTAGDAGRVHDLGREFARTQADLEATLEEWAKFLE